MHAYTIEAKINLKRMIMRGLVQKLRGEHPMQRQPGFPQGMYRSTRLPGRTRPRPANSSFSRRNRSAAARHAFSLDFI